MAFLTEYDFKTQYRSVSKNNVAYYLSTVIPEKDNDEFYDMSGFFIDAGVSFNMESNFEYTVKYLTAVNMQENDRKKEIQIRGKAKIFVA